MIAAYGHRSEDARITRSTSRHFLTSGFAAAGALLSAGLTYSLIGYAHVASHADATLLWSLLALLGAALTACLSHLALIQACTGTIAATGTHTVIGHSVMAFMRVVAPRAARNVLIAGTTAGCAMALATAPGQAAQEYSAPPAVSLALGAENSESPTDSHTHIDASNSGPTHATPGLGWASSTTPRPARATATADMATAALNPALSHTTTHEPDAADRGADPDTVHSYTVVAGDTLWDLASREVASHPGSHSSADIAAEVSAITAANPQITNPSMIVPGQVLTLPNPSSSTGQ